MKLSTLLNQMVSVAPQQDCEIKQLTLDSRTVTKGALFVALPGELVDGRDYIEPAIARGAAAVVYELSGCNELNSDEVPLIGVKDLSQKLSEIAGRFYQHPSRLIQLIGVTGTNGKSSVAFMLTQGLAQLGVDAAMIGTIGVGRPDALRASALTTPDAITVQAWLRELVDDGIKTACMEVSSHGLEQGRVAALAFDMAVFTNLSQDHLDYHGTMAAYGDAKRALFMMPGLKLSVLNQDDEFGAALAESLNHAVMTYGQDLSSTLVISQYSTNEKGLRLALATDGQTRVMNSALIGDFNAWNLAASVAVLIGMGYSLEQSAAALEWVAAPAGRAERVQASVKPSRANQPFVVVDYAHTPDALEQVLRSLRACCDGELAVVFGCGGDRDKTKRPLMGQVAETEADKVILTDDNPRGESPQAIIADIVTGMKTTPLIVHDRYKAIRVAIEAAAQDDWVLIAGKGHETTQTYADRVVPFDDSKVAYAVLEKAA